MKITRTLLIGALSLTLLLPSTLAFARGGNGNGGNPEKQGKQAGQKLEKTTKPQKEAMGKTKPDGEELQRRVTARREAFDNVVAMLERRILRITAIADRLDGLGANTAEARTHLDRATALIAETKTQEDIIIGQFGEAAKLSAKDRKAPLKAAREAAKSNRGKLKEAHSEIKVAAKLLRVELEKLIPDDSGEEEVAPPVDAPTDAPQVEGQQ